MLVDASREVATRVVTTNRASASSARRTNVEAHDGWHRRQHRPRLPPDIDREVGGRRTCSACAPQRLQHPQYRDPRLASREAFRRRHECQRRSKPLVVCRNVMRGAIDDEIAGRENDLDLVALGAGSAQRRIDRHARIEWRAGRRGDAGDFDRR